MKIEKRRGGPERMEGRGPRDPPQGNERWSPEPAKHEPEKHSPWGPWAPPILKQAMFGVDAGVCIGRGIVDLLWMHPFPMEGTAKGTSKAPTVLSSF